MLIWGPFRPEGTPEAQETRARAALAALKAGGDCTPAWEGALLGLSRPKAFLLRSAGALLGRRAPGERELREEPLLLLRAPPEVLKDAGRAGLLLRLLRYALEASRAAIARAAARSACRAGQGPRPSPGGEGPPGPRPSPGGEGPPGPRPSPGGEGPLPPRARPRSHGPHLAALQESILLRCLLCAAAGPSDLDPGPAFLGPFPGEPPARAATPAPFSAPACAARRACADLAGEVLAENPPLLGDLVTQGLSCGALRFLLERCGGARGAAAEAAEGLLLGAREAVRLRGVRVAAELAGMGSLGQRTGRIAVEVAAAIVADCLALPPDTGLAQATARARVAREALAALKEILEAAPGLGGAAGARAAQWDPLMGDVHTELQPQVMGPLHGAVRDFAARLRGPAEP